MTALRGLAQDAL